jgi:hypothetical protein
MQQVSIASTEKMKLGSLLQKVAHKSNFSFVYNNQYVHADSVVSVKPYNGRLDNFLNGIFGSNYEFKEVPGYVVIRHAPGRFYMVADADRSQPDQILIKGHVMDVQTNQNISGVSVYEKNFSTSTLTDAQGNFELRLKKPDGQYILTASKDNYRDTSLYLLQDVIVNSTVKEKRYKYDPTADQYKGKKRNGLSRLFVSSKQTLQDMNLGGLFQYSPYQISLTPGLSSHGMFNSQVINHVSINLIGGYTAGIDGVELSGGFNIDRSDVKYFQAATLFNFVGRNFKGVQLAGLYNHVVNNASGFQASGIINIAHNFKSGVQATIVGNFVDTSGGVQVSYILNRAKNVAGTQIAAILNRAKKVKGIQIGLINIADSSDYTLGVLNLVKNGDKSIAISADNASTLHLEFRSGGHTLYGLVGYEYNNINSVSGLDLGFGVHTLRIKRFGLDLEYTSQNGISFTSAQGNIHALKTLPTYTFHRHFRLFAGPTLNLARSPEDNQLKTSGWVINQHFDSGNKIVWSTGFNYGLQFLL